MINVFLLFLHVKSIPENFPLLITECSNGEEFNSLSYNCSSDIFKACTTDNLTNYSTNSNISREDCINNGSIPGCSLCLTSAYYTANISSKFSQSTDVPTFINILSSQGSDQTSQVQYSSSFITEVNQTIINYVSEPENPNAAHGISNLCSLTHFNTDISPCKLLSSTSSGMYGYQFWPSDQVFSIYTTNVKDNILSEQIFQSNFTLDRQINLYLATYTRNGTFIGYTLLDHDFEHCNIRYQDRSIWRTFGYNFYSECTINLYNVLNKTNEYFYEPFLEDNTVGNDVVIRPIPVVDLSATNSSGAAVNFDSNYGVFGRTFFLYDNFTTDNYVQYLNNFTLYFDQDSSGNLLNPQVIVSYIQVSKADLVEQFPTLKNLVNNVSNPYYSFSVVYTKSLEKFWSILMTVFIVYAIIVLLSSFFMIFIYYASNCSDGLNLNHIMKILGIILQAISMIFILPVFFLSVYYWFFFKLQTSASLFLPPGEEFPLLRIFFWAGFASIFISVILHILSTIGSDFFLVDWETPISDEKPVSTWRRIMIANEWYNILTIHPYSITFTVITLIFILVPFEVEWLTCPIPKATLNDSGIFSEILRVGWILLLFFVLAFLQWLWCEVIYWRFFGDPYLNFIDLCSTANISLVALFSPQHGYYIHGRCANPHSDEPMHRLHGNLAAEGLGIASSRGISPQQGDQVFECFFAAEFRQRFMELYKSIQAQMGGSIKRLKAADIHEAMSKSFNPLNQLLMRFFDLSQSEFRVDIVKNPPFLQKLFGFSPEVVDTSQMIPVGERAFKNILFAGHQWSFYCLYAFLFTGVDMHTKNPVIAAFTVFLADHLFSFLYKLHGKRIISKKALLDYRFFE